jgi:hypothetical protein
MLTDTINCNIPTHPKSVDKGVEWFLLVPVSEDVSFVDELLTLRGLGHNVREHLLSSQMSYDSHFPVDELLDPEVSDVNVARSFGRRRASLHQCHTAEIVLV